ncbi:MAG TPA: restriction endonuclease subunit S [Candidatus Enterococcus avicola]|uniref:Restriction endonuclease subunit S n=1 Tax=Candidatus Enterococcus avicola TaxID=2838561 RepID=A0A9D2JJ15_9ENTE|nr:restriction endonuclease subunit S [Candidatus Enterococcus avicola]
MMSKKSPQLRFEGFTDDWEQRKLTDITSSYSGLTYSPTDVQDKGTFVLRSSNVKNDQLIDADNVYVNPDIVNSNNVKVGDVIVVVRNGSRSLIGKHAIVTKEMPHTVIGAFMSAFRGENGDYINALLSTNNFQKEVHKSLGATINQITGKDFSMMNFQTPKLEEQNKIGSFFKQLDNTIALHQRKLDLLKEQKKGYLQKMFPKNGEKVPELRFAGFADDWEQRKLGELSNIVGGGTPSTSNSEYWDGDIDWYAPAEIGEQRYVSKSKKTITELGLKKSSARILPVGTVLFTSRAGIGNTAILGKEATTNQGFQSIVPNPNKLDSYFIYSRTNELKRYGEVTGTGSTFVEVSGKQMSKMPIMIPELSEQQKIGSFFKQLDDTIALHQRKCEQLKELKKFMLQNMFPKKG